MVTNKWLTKCRFGAIVVIGFGQLLFSDRSLAEPSLANLLIGKQELDPRLKQLDQLAAQLAEIERRPFAEDAEVQHALAEARAELSRARAAYSQGAQGVIEPTLQRNLALVRAALSAADRLEARMFALAAFARLRQQADEMEAAAQAAEAVLAQTRAQTP
jgi:hypothetical protein